MSETFVIEQPTNAPALPLVFDSPHSGRLFPPDFNSSVPHWQLQSGCDLFVDDLWSAIPDIGGVLLHASYSRMYIDLNRAPDDIDPLLLSHPSDKIRPTSYSDRGMGLIRRLALPDVPVYAQTFSLADIEQRISGFYTPYHRQLAATLDQLYAQFGGVWHIDCHSMKSRANAMNIDSGSARPDVVLGDNAGTSAGEEFVNLVENTLLELGYTVARNTPYKGGYLVCHYGDVANNRHSMQIEINRVLYMDERTFLPTDNYFIVQQDLTTVAMAIARYLKTLLASNTVRNG